ncbi:Leucine-zipper-like transcriptional regulator 1 [Paramecium bursaria]
MKQSKQVLIRRRVASMYDEQERTIKITSLSLQNVIQNKEKMNEYNQTMKMKQQEQFQKLSQRYHKNKLQINVRQRTIIDKNIASVKQRINEAEAQDFVHKLFSNPEKPIIKGYVSLPLQNENQYTMPESRQGCRVVKLGSMGIVLGGYSHKEHIDFNVLNLLNCQWRRKQEFYYNAAEKLRIKLKQNIQLPLGSNFSASQSGSTIYIFGGERNIGARRTTNVITKISFHHEEIEWVQYNTRIPSRRNHISEILDKNMIIVGGLDDSDQRSNYLSDMYSIDLTNLQVTQLNPKYFKNGKQMQQSLILNGLAYHSSVLVGNPGMRMIVEIPHVKTDEQQNHSYDLDIKEGIYIYGGKNCEDEMNNHLYLLSTQTYPPLFQEIQTQGKQPDARRCCSLNYDDNISAIIMFGGTNDEIIFGDLYLNFLRNYTWSQVKLSGYLNYSCRFDHCSIYSEDKLIIFGGLNETGFLLFHPITISIRFKKIKEQL